MGTYRFSPRVTYVILAVLAALLSSPWVGWTQSTDHLPGTEPLTARGDLSLRVVAGVDRFYSDLIDASAGRRERYWHPDYGSFVRYAASVDSNRKNLRTYTGAVDRRLTVDALELLATSREPAHVAAADRFEIYAVRWPVFDGVYAYGYWLEPTGKVGAQVVVVPDADWTPEQIAGIAPGLPVQAQLARRFADAGVRVLVPALVDRSDTWSGNPLVRPVEIPHRSFIYLQAFHLGRHIIGYEMQMVMAAVDYFESRSARGETELPIGVAGYGEGGLIALYTSAVDQRIDATLVSGYFEGREKMWKEPLYRSVWGFLEEFGDARVAGLIAPRPLVIEASRGPGDLDTFRQRLQDRDTSAAARLVTPLLESVKREFEIARVPYDRLGISDRISLVTTGSNGAGMPGSTEAVTAFLRQLGREGPPPAHGPGELIDRREDFDPAARMKILYDQLIDYNQELMRRSSLERSKFWSQVDSLLPIQRANFQRNRTWTEEDTFPIGRWNEAIPFYRDYFWKEIVGWLPEITRPPNPRSRAVYETSEWTGYEVVTDAWPGVINYGILLVPKNISPGERRPVVVTQHGHAGTPQDVTNPDDTTGAYHAFGARLADRGFVVYAPQNLYTFDDIFRPMQRKAHPLKQTFFAAMVRQHEQVLEWLGGLSFVDPERIGFYGLSYGGKSAMFIPALLEDYALSICSGDFNERVWKHVDDNSDYVFAYTGNNSQLEFGIGETFNYAEIAALIAPRPFMVERGHYDIVAPDEWVAYEYARVRWLYAELGIPDRTAITFFPGPHAIHGDETFSFLHKHLHWPE